MSGLCAELLPNRWSFADGDGVQVCKAVGALLQWRSVAMLGLSRRTGESSVRAVSGE